MVSETARVLALRLLSSYPGWPVSELSVLAIAEALDQMGEHAEMVVEMARIDYTKPPSVSQLFEVLDQVEREATPTQRLSLPEVAGVSMPPEVKAKFVRMVENPAGFRVGQLTERDRELEEQEAEWRRKRAASLAVTRDMKSCSGFGKAPVERDGKLVCPDCGVEVPDIEVRGMPPKRRKGATA